jgi:hypothetical protein
VVEVSLERLFEVCQGEVDPFERLLEAVVRRVKQNDPKPTDRRSFSGETVQCEAIPPDVLAAIIRDAIEQRLDQGAYEAVLEAEREIRESLAPRLAALLADLGGAP